MVIQKWDEGVFEMIGEYNKETYLHRLWLKAKVSHTHHIWCTARQSFAP